jgi:branched-chain amino acid transport system substrate-binding protein
MIPVLLSCIARPVPVAVVLPETGDWGEYGQCIKEGVLVAEDYIEEEHFQGFRLRVRYYNSRSDPAAARRAMGKALDLGAVAVIGAATTTEALQMIPLADRMHRALVSPSASAAQLRGMSRYFFRVYPSDQAEVRVAAKFIVENLEARRVTLFVQDNVFSRSIARDLSAELKALEGGLSDLRVLPEDPAALWDTVRKGLKEGPNTVYLAAYSNTLLHALRAIRQSGFTGSLVTTSAFNSPGILRRAGALAEGLYFLRPPFSPDAAGNPTAAAFLSRYRERFHKDPEVFAAYGFDALLVLAEAVRLAGGVAGDLPACLAGVTNLQGATGPISFVPSGEALKVPKVFRVVNGRSVDFLDSLEQYRSRMLQEIEKRKRGLGAPL